MRRHFSKFEKKKFLLGIVVRGLYMKILHKVKAERSKSICSPSCVHFCQINDPTRAPLFALLPKEPDYIWKSPFETFKGSLIVFQIRAGWIFVCGLLQVLCNNDVYDIPVPLIFLRDIIISTIVSWRSDTSHKAAPTMSFPLRRCKWQAMIAVYEHMEVI